MSEAFVAEIRLVPFNFAPQGWAMCSGQLLPISQNTALFSLLGTQYGGDGISTYALPNLNGSVAMHTDRYSGSGQFPIGSFSGSTSVTLLLSEIPAHTHASSFKASASPATASTPSATTVPAAGGRGARPSFAATANSSAPMTTIVGGSQPHNNLMPYLVLNYIIALQGIYPPRS